MFRVEAVIYMPMETEETQEQAEDRFLEKIEDAGMEVYSWTDVNSDKKALLKEMQEQINGLIEVNAKLRKALTKQV